MSPGQMLHGQMYIWQLSQIIKSEWVIVQNFLCQKSLHFSTFKIWEIAEMAAKVLKKNQTKPNSSKPNQIDFDNPEWVGNIMLKGYGDKMPLYWLFWKGKLS